MFKLNIETKKKIIKHSGKFFIIFNSLIFIIVAVIIYLKLK